MRMAGLVAANLSSGQHCPEAVLTDLVDEQAHNLRMLLDGWAAEGRTTGELVFKGPLPALYSIVNRLQAESDEPCAMCEARRERNEMIERVKNYGFGKNKDWRKDAKANYGKNK